MNKEMFGLLLEEYLTSKRDEIKKKYNRLLPTGEYLYDRFDKAKYINAGEGSSIYDTSVIMGDVVIGKNVWIGPYTLLEGINDNLSIGDFVTIDTGVMIYTHDTTKYTVSGAKSEVEKGPVSIGNYSVIGTLSVITCNVEIGNHCIIGAHSFVNSNIPDYSVAFGTPARVVGKVSFDNEGKCLINYYNEH